MFERLRKKFYRQGTENKSYPQSPEDGVRDIVDKMFRDMETTGHELADIADMSIASQVLTKPRLTARVLVFFHPFQLGPKFPLHSLYSNAWIDDPAQIISIAQATLLEFVHEAQIYQSDSVSLVNYAHLFVGRIRQMEENERELEEAGQGPITYALNHVLEQHLSAKGDFNINQALTNTTFLSPDGTFVEFPKLLEPVFALAPIHSQVIGILAEDLQKVGDAYLGLKPTR